MAKARLHTSNPDYVEFFCEGCNGLHIVNTNPANKGPCWTFNGDFDKPTIRASVLNTSGHFVNGQPQPPDCKTCNACAEDGWPSLCGRCHIFVTDGNIEYLSDCTYKYIGVTRPMRDIEEALNDPSRI